MSFLKKYRPLSLNEFSFNNDIHSFFEYSIHTNKFNILIHGDSGVGKSAFLEVFTEKYIQHIYDTNSHNLTIQDIKKNNILNLIHIQKININSIKKYLINFCKSSLYYKKKLIILDDLDDYDDGLQNIFSKLIETYSKNVNFLCSCTILQNIIPKLQGQIIKIKLYKMPKNILIDKIIYVLKQENMKIECDEDSIYTMLCNKTNFNITNILVQLQKIKFSTIDINIPNIQKIVYLFNGEIFEEYISNIENVCVNNDFQSYLLNQLDSIERTVLNGYSILDFLENFYSYLKQIYDDFESKYIQKSDILRMNEIIIYYIDKFYDTEEHYLNYFFIYDIYCIFQNKNITNHLH